MRLSSITKRGLLISGPFIALYFCLVGCPAKAKAGCGDYVIRGKRTANTALVMPQDIHFHPGKSKDPKAPCSGPHCSRGSHSPLGPQSTVFSMADHWALAQNCITFKEMELVQPVSSVDSAHIHRNGSAVYHPPRA